MATRRFLTAAWRNILMLNYAVEPELLHPLVPARTELDTWNGETVISLVGFLFTDTRVLGVAIPGHRTFEEVNLRFYVRREVHGEERRGVTFIRELVPRWAIATVARLAYNEPYLALPMQHRYGPFEQGVPSDVEYSWRLPSGWARVSGVPSGSGRNVAADSQEQFITEHYWGYTRQRDGSTVEYQVTHPSWRVWRVESPGVAGADLSPLYGAAFASLLRERPLSALFADGSDVTVFRPTRLPHADTMNIKRPANTR